MIKKHAVLIGIIISLSLLIVATQVYPGGSLADKNSIGFQWTKNFISNLFAAKAVNGLDNPSRIWADIGMIFLSISFGLFFINFSKKIPKKGAATIVKILRAGSMVCTFLLVTPLHDLMIAISSTLILVCIFYITVFVFRSRLTFFKIFCTACMLIFYSTLFLYGTGRYAYLPIMQKITFISVIILILCLEYFTVKNDFAGIKASKEGF